MAATDPLNALANRRAFNHAMQRCFAEAHRYQNDLACLMIDLDGFKKLNDTKGHPAGDELLQRTARVLEENCRRCDIAGRYGGDEFIVLLPQTDMATAEQVAGRIDAEYAITADAMVRATNLAGQVGTNIGLATLRQSRRPIPNH